MIKKYQGSSEFAKNDLKFHYWMKKLFIILLSVVILIILFFVIFYFKDNAIVSKINNFKDCADNGFPIMESYPRQCRTPDGRNFVEEIENVTGKEDLIVV